MRCNTSSRRFLPDADWGRCQIRVSTQGTPEASLSIRRGIIPMRKNLRASLVLLATLPAFGAQSPDAAYVQSFEKWRAELVDGRKQQWLPLAGLFWLKA